MTKCWLLIVYHFSGQLNKSLDQEECLEVSDDLLVYGRMWKVLGECQKDPNAARDYIRRCTQKLFQVKGHQTWKN